MMNFSQSFQKCLSLLLFDQDKLVTSKLFETHSVLPKLAPDSAGLYVKLMESYSDGCSRYRSAWSRLLLTKLWPLQALEVSGYHTGTVTWLAQIKLIRLDSNPQLTDHETRTLPLGNNCIPGHQQT